MPRPSCGQRAASMSWTCQGYCLPGFSPSPILNLTEMTNDIRGLLATRNRVDWGVCIVDYSTQLMYKTVTS